MVETDIRLGRFRADRARPSSWWRRNVVSDTHREPDREPDPAAFRLTVAVSCLLSLPVWAGVGLLLARAFG